ncbi:MalY/PatB family protein [Rathayibacter soli]|uniref:MalY/PatB family protein n=1 Tax=Rathayibacter soli TaxID=3144168 RepID=UPI0027E449A3|nr:aminotransferase class I/II-fold pyridoxal phosphate-dependent enzyme [Glaciibacter superstes]
MDVHAEPLATLRTRTSEKWAEYPDDVLPLFVAEMDYPLAEPIAAALADAIRRSDTGYAGPGRNPLPAAFTDFARRRWGWSVDPKHLSTTTDVSVVLVESLRLSITPGDPVVITPPIYPPFFDLVPEAGGSVVEVPLLDDGATWALDLDGIEAAFAAGARAMLLCNPHNPVGLVHPADQLARLAEIAAQYDATIISDEIHAPLCHLSSTATPTGADAPFTPFLSVSDAAREHGVAAHSASKAWNLAGLKCALFVTASDRMRTRLSALPDEVHFRTSLFGRIANAAAFAEGEEWLDGVLRSIRSNRALLTTLLTERMPEVGYREPAASYLAWLDLRALGWGDDPRRHILKHARVALNAGHNFGAQGAGFVRLNFACSPEVLTEAIDRMARLVHP